MGVFIKCYLHLILTTRNSAPLIDETWRNELYRLFENRLRLKGHELLAINGSDNHVHILVSTSSEFSIAEIIKDLKMQSLQFAFSLTSRQKRLRWQRGFAAMSYSHSQVNAVVKFINAQQTYHATKSYKEEMEDLLDMFEVGYEEHELDSWICEPYASIVQSKPSAIMLQFSNLNRTGST